MSKPKLLIIAYRAYGDHLYTSPIYPLLLEKFDVYFETNTKGYHLFYDDIRFKKLAVYSAFEGKPQSEYADLFKERWIKVREQVQPDHEINLNGTLEVDCIAEEFQEEFWKPVGERRAIFGANGFYDAVFRRAGIPIPKELNLNGFYWTPEQTENVRKWRDKHKDQFVVILPISGTTPQKVFHGFKEAALAILDKYEDSVVYLAGDEPCRSFVFDHPRVKTMIGQDVSIKQAVHRAGYADLVLGPETFLMAAAGMWGTPKVILCSASSVWQMTQYTQNDFSIQSPVYCSPCHRAIYTEQACEFPFLDENGKFLTTSCSKYYPLETVLHRVDYIYQHYFKGGNNVWKRHIN